VVPLLVTVDRGGVTPLNNEFRQLAAHNHVILMDFKLDFESTCGFCKFLIRRGRGDVPYMSSDIHIGPYRIHFSNAKGQITTHTTYDTQHMIQ